MTDGDIVACPKCPASPRISYRSNRPGKDDCARCGKALVVVPNYNPDEHPRPDRSHVRDEV